MIFFAISLTNWLAELDSKTIKYDDIHFGEYENYNACFLGVFSNRNRTIISSLL